MDRGPPLPNNSMVTGGMDKLALAVDRLDRLKFPPTFV